MEPSVRIHTPILLPFAPISFIFCTSWFLHNLRPPSTAMVTELPPSRFKMTGSLASLRRLMGWQAPGLASKLKNGVASLANMRSSDFIFFVAYALAGLVPSLSSFLTLLEYYGLQLQHLSANSITLVVIFLHGPPVRDLLVSRSRRRDPLIERGKPNTGKSPQLLL
jgi:hypothetical protein